MKRRQFLGHANCAALGSLGTINTLLNLRLINNAIAAPADPNDYKALVVIILGGGNDAFNMLVPTETSEYANYAAIRSNLALPSPDPMNPDALLPLNVSNTPGRTFGLHSAMPNLQSRFNEGNAAFLANVGALVEPTTVSQFNNKSVDLPRSLFSHNDQQDIWASTSPLETTKTGWAGRLADNIMSCNPSNNVSMNISLDGNNFALVGDTSFSYAITPDGAPVLNGTSGNAIELARGDTAKSLAEQQQRELLRRAFNNENKRAFDISELFNDAVSGASLGTNFGNADIEEKLEAVAKTIASRSALGHNRQIFAVPTGGFDNHPELLNKQRTLLGRLDNGLDSFWSALTNLGLTNDVTVITVSEFGRTLRSNGQGTDHAWGSHALMMGGAVDGGKIFGSYPDDSDLTLGSGLDVGSGNGRILPTTSVEEYYAEAALWMGLPSGQLDEVLPNLDRFYSYSAANPPLGYLL
ncbi:MAG: DUF1501 domain-containing protein [Roseibacillus sp.]